MNDTREITYLEAKNFKSDIICTEHLLLSLLKEKEGLAAQVMMSFNTDYNIVYNELKNILEGKPISSQTSSQRSSPQKVKTPALDHFGRDLTQLAAQGKLDPIIGRDKIIERVAQILSRRKKNNPVLIGEPGVGKTAIAEGLALRIIDRKVPRIQRDEIPLLVGRDGIIWVIGHGIANPFRCSPGMFPAVLSGVNVDMSQVDGDVFDVGAGDQFQQRPHPGQFADQAQQEFIRKGVAGIYRSQTDFIEDLSCQRFDLCGGHGLLPGDFGFLRPAFLLQDAPPALRFFI